MEGRFASAVLLSTLLVMLSGCATGPAVPGDPEPIPHPSPGGLAPGDPEPAPLPSPGGPVPGAPAPTPVFPESEPPGDGTYGGDQGDEGGDPGDEAIGGGPGTAVTAFQERCAQGVEEWRDGRVDYPDRISVAIEVGANYNAAIDVRSEPLPPDEVIEVEDGTATSEAVLVKCTVAARLTAVGEALQVADQASETDAGWVVQEFTPSGVIEWSWTVTAHLPVDEQLRLELRPAIVVDESAGDLEYAGKNVSSFTTDVHVEASVLHHAAHWVSVYQPLIWTIAGAIGAAVLGVILWWNKVRGTRKRKPRPKRASGPGPLAPPGSRQLRPE